jgi:uncharacterized repeat protein (TIGR04138 family)
MQHDPEFAEIVTLICKEDGRYDRNAYEFVRRGLDHTVKELRKRDAARGEPTRHVTGTELLNGLRAYALDQFGPLSKTVLNNWGVRECRDFGEIVFNLIEYKVFSKTANDRREDFNNLYNFDDAFVRPFLPERRRSGPSTAEAIGSA